MLLSLSLSPEFGNFCAGGEPNAMSTTSIAGANPGIVFSYKSVEDWPPCLASFSIPRSLVDAPLAGGQISAYSILMHIEVLDVTLHEGDNFIFCWE